MFRDIAITFAGKNYVITINEQGKVIDVETGGNFYTEETHPHLYETMQKLADWSTV